MKKQREKNIGSSKRKLELRFSISRPKCLMLKCSWEKKYSKAVLQHKLKTRQMIKLLIWSLCRKFRKHSKKTNNWRINSNQQLVIVRVVSRVMKTLTWCLNKRLTGINRTKYQINQNQSSKPTLVKTNLFVFGSSLCKMFLSNTNFRSKPTMMFTLREVRSTFAMAGCQTDKCSKDMGFAWWPTSIITFL